MIGGIKDIIVKQGKVQEFEVLFAKLKALVRKHEPGNLYYDLYQSKTNEHVYRVMERYKHEEALQAHKNSEYGKEIFPQFHAILEKLEVGYFNSID